MSETIATFIAGYSLAGMAKSRFRTLAPTLLAVATAEAGVRLLSPGKPALSGDSVEASAYFEPTEIERGRRFARPQLALALARQAIQAGVLTAIVGRARREGRGREGGPAAGAIEALKLTTALSLASMPLTVVSRRRSMAVGLDTQSWSGWAADVAKASAISGAISAGTGALLTRVTVRHPRRWWLPAAAGSVVAGGLFGALAPVLLDPLFNDFDPLPEGETRSDVLELAEAAGVRVGEVYVVDASRRTTGANAYVNGLGPSKRVVLYDTLLDRYDRRQVRVVVAHELSHVRHRDVPRALALTALIAPATAWATQELSRTLGPPEGRPGLPAMALAFAVVSLPVGLVAGRLSRAVERRADAESLELSRDPDAFISFQRAVVLQNMGDVEPPKWVRVLLASHPGTLERIAAAVAYRDRVG
jgi:STE24 endopeptidase